MRSHTHKQAGKSNPNRLWKMQTVNINKPIYSKNIQNAGKKRDDGKSYVAWISLIPIKI
jgi:hypothetical protein